MGAYRAGVMLQLLTLFRREISQLPGWITGPKFPRLHDRLGWQHRPGGDEAFFLHHNAFLE